MVSLVNPFSYLIHRTARKAAVPSEADKDQTRKAIHICPTSTPPLTYRNHTLHCIELSYVHLYVTHPTSIILSDCKNIMPIVGEVAIKRQKKEKEKRLYALIALYVDISVQLWVIFYSTLSSALSLFGNIIL